MVIPKELFEILSLLRIDEQVLRLDVSMDHIVSVTELNSLQQLVDILANCFRDKPILPFFEYL
jgi:hypothetical protein